MSQFQLLRVRRFAPLFVTQALGAFNDNAFRNALVMLVAFHMGLADRTVALYTNLAPALFIVPFFLFSASAGQWAERCEKARIVRLIKLFEVAAMSLALFGFLTGHVGLLLVVLFLMGVHSTAFGPIKYAILPQALHRDELVGGNALVESGTQLSILAGLMLGAMVIEVPHIGPALAGSMGLVVAIVGYVASRGIPPAPATAPQLRVGWNPWRETRRVLAITRRDREVLGAIIAISWYWFYATVLVAQLPNYTRAWLGGDGSVAIFVLALFSVGTALGALACEHLSARRVEIGLVPLGALGLTACGVDVAFARPEAVAGPALDWLGLVRSTGSWRPIMDLTLIGVFAGIYVVPLFAFVQSRTEASGLSRVIAGNNIINALFICLAAVFGLGLNMLGWSVPHILLAAAVLGAVVMTAVFVRVPAFGVRCVVWLRRRPG